jgi:hypothetical protein
VAGFQQETHQKEKEERTCPWLISPFACVCRRPRVTFASSPGHFVVSLDAIDCACIVYHLTRCLRTGYRPSVIVWY